MVKKQAIGLIFVSLILTACGQSGRNAPIIATPLPPSAAIKAQQILAEDLGIGPNWIRIESVQEKQWSNTCLDAQAPDEVCDQQVTPGYLIMLAYNGKTHTFHTDLDGNQIREAQPEPILSEAALQSRQLLAGFLTYDPDSIHFISEESVLFADSCLEISIPETVCPQVQIRGKQITLEADNNLFEFRTPDNPLSPVLAVAAGVKGGDLVIMLSRDGGPDNYCDNLNITLSGYVIQYSCRNVPGEVPGIFTLAEEEQAQLIRWMLEYSSFDVTQTRLNGVKIRLTFTGTGSEGAAFEEQEIIREFSEELLTTPAPFPTPLPTLFP